MSNDELLPQIRYLMLSARIDVLTTEGRAHFQREGIPASEVTEDALLHYALDHLSTAERAAFGIPTREQFTELLAFAEFANILEDIQEEEEGEPKVPLGVKDPKEAETIEWMQRRLRASQAEEAYWHGDSDRDEAE